MTAPALRIEGLAVAYRNGDAWHEAIRDVDLTIGAGASVGLVGESGSGKTTLALAVMRYLGGTGRVTRGRIELAGRDMLALDESELRAVRRERVRLVPQDPLASLNPSLTIGRQVAEGLARRPGAPGAGRPRRKVGTRERVDALLASVGLADTDRVAASYPHQLSGGMQQRVAIAMALGGEPDLLVMDEPTTNLDVTTEATILDLVRDLVRDRGTAVLYVSHSLGVVATLCDRVAVLYAGELVETAGVAAAYAGPLHPYTRGLLASLPRVGQDRHLEPLRPIPGRLPEPSARPAGCVFAPRCPVAIDDVCAVRPPLEAADADGPARADADEARRVRCHRWREIAAGALDPRPPARARPATADPPPGPARPRTPVATPPAGRQPGRARPGLGAPGPDGATPPVLAVTGLAKRFPVRRGPIDALLGRPARSVRALEGATLEVRRTRTLGLVGESGSGKSTLARCVVGLIEPSEGAIELLGVPLARRLERRDAAELRALQMVFQNSGDALNPYLTVGESLRRPLRRLARLPRAEAAAEARRLLEAVNLPAAFATRTPAELSGGEQQRVAIARAFASRPDLVVFDESVSGLDVSIQAALLELLTRLQAERRSAYLFISHDLAVVSYLADDVAVIYLGAVMELGPTASVLRPPYHPYTEALLSAVPIPDPDLRRDRVRLRGEAPSPVDLPGGCPFHTRCPRFLGDVCVREVPPWRHDPAAGKGVACHIPLETLREAQRPRFDLDPPLVAPGAVEGS